MKRIKAIEQIRHFSKKTYQNILKFHKIARSTETIMWMKKELLMTDSDIGLDQHPLGFLNNLDYIVRVLKTNCQNQTLKLDLDIKDVLNHRLSNTADCELAE